MPIQGKQFHNTPYSRTEIARFLVCISYLLISRIKKPIGVFLGGTVRLVLLGLSPPCSCQVAAFHCFIVMSHVMPRALGAILAN